MNEEQHRAWVDQVTKAWPTPGRSPHDYIVQRKDDGFSQDFWLSDSDSGRKEIARLEAEAANPAPPAALVTGAWNAKQQRAYLSGILEGLAQAYKKDRAKMSEQIEAHMAEERERLRDDVRRSLLNYRESLADMAAELDAVKKLRIQLIDELDAARKQMPPRLIKMS